MPFLRASTACLVSLLLLLRQASCADLQDGVGLLPELVGMSDPRPPPFRCKYGHELGIWRNSSLPGSRWQIINRQCPLHNLIPHAQPHDGAVPPHPPQDPTAPVHPRILFLSDSIDFIIVEAYCNALGGTMTARMESTRPEMLFSSGQPDETNAWANAPGALHHYIQSNLCTSNTSARILHTFLFAVSPIQPYWGDKIVNFTMKIEDAALVWAKYSELKPDLVVVASNAWDQMRLLRLHRHDAAFQQEMPQSILRDYAYNLSRVIHETRAAFPGVHMLFHTSPGLAYDPATNRQNHGGSHVSHTFELNAFGAATARLLGLEVVDYQQIMQRFGSSAAFLADDLHPQSWLLLDLMNIYINYVRELQHSGLRDNG